MDNIISTIADVVCSARDVSHDELLSADRTRHIAHARQEAIWLAHNLTNLSLPAIGRKFNRDHTTVLNSIRRVQERRNDDEYRNGLIRIQAQITERISQ